MKVLRFLLISLVFLIIAGCGTEETVVQSAEESEDSIEELKIYTTLYPLAYFANEIGGEFVNVESIIPAGTDAHTYEPTSNTMVSIAEADLFIYNLADSEAYATTIKSALENESVMFLEAGEGLDLMGYSHDHSHDHGHGEDDHHHEDEDHDHGHGEDDHHHEDEVHDHGHGEDDHHHHEDEDHDHGHGEDDHHHHEDEDHDHGHGEDDHHHHEDEDHDHGHGEDDHHHHEDEDHDHGHDGHSHGDYDPHVWISPTLSIELAENIKAKLVEIMPEQEEVFQANFNDLVERLEALDETFSETINQFTNRTILVTHAAYGYWERDFDIEQIAITGLSPSDEPSQQQLANILDLVADSSINHVLFEQNIQPRVATVIQEEAGLESLQLHNLEVLTPEDIENEEDYFSLMERNISVLEEALTE